MNASADDRDLLSTEENRRDFLVLLAGALGAVGVAATIWPFVDSMNPAADVIAAGAPIDFDLSPLKPGQQVLVMWQSKPVFVVRRTPADLETLKKPQDINQLRDPNSSENQQPPYAKNWHRSVAPEFAVLVGICTHLGCIPHFEPKPGGFLGPSWPGGYFCPCHGSKYDFAGRVWSGVPAPYNLPVPPYHFVDKTTVRIGENPKGTHWEFGSIVQI